MRPRLTAHDRVSRPVNHRGKEDNQTRKRGYAGPLAVGPARINERETWETDERR